MNINVQKYCQRENIKHFITAFFIFFLSQFLFLAFMGYMSKQKGVLRDAMVFVMEAYSFANFQKTKDGIRHDTLDMYMSCHQLYLFSPH